MFKSFSNFSYFIPAMTVRLSVFIVVAVFLFSSCKVAKHSYIFKGITRDTSINNLPDSFNELRIKKNDVLAIFISSLNNDEDRIFNAVVSSEGGKGEDAGGAGYQVNPDGCIFLHKLGKVKVEGLTRRELKSKLEKDLQPYLKDPIVTINFNNHFITVLGEISKPQRFLMPEEKISLIDMLALSGSFTPNSRLTDLMIIRDSSNSKIFKRLNLENHSIFSSPMYYLQPNDIVVVNPDEEKIKREANRMRYQTVVTTSLQLLSIVLIVYQTFFRK